MSICHLIFPPGVSYPAKCELNRIILSGWGLVVLDTRSARTLAIESGGASGGCVFLWIERHSDPREGVRLVSKTDYWVCSEGRWWKL